MHPTWYRIIETDGSEFKISIIKRLKEIKEDGKSVKNYSHLFMNLFKRSDIKHEKQQLKERIQEMRWIKQQLKEPQGDVDNSLSLDVLSYSTLKWTD